MDFKKIIRGVQESAEQYRNICDVVTVGVRSLTILKDAPEYPEFCRVMCDGEPSLMSTLASLERSLTSLTTAIQETRRIVQSIEAERSGANRAG